MKLNTLQIIDNLARGNMLLRKDHNVVVYLDRSDGRQPLKSFNSKLQLNKNPQCDPEYMLLARELFNSESHWELYEYIEPHDFSWAIEQLKKGHKVRRHNWGNPRFYISLSSDGYVMGSCKLRDYEAQDWTVFE